MDNPVVAQKGGKYVVPAESIHPEPTHGPVAVLNSGVLGNFEPNYPSKSGPGMQQDTAQCHSVENIYIWSYSVLYITSK
jgi:hypothetical protein